MCIRDRYGKVELIPRAESEIPTINFDRAVRSCSEDLINKISEDEEFNQLMGDILIELLANQGIQEYNYGIQQRVQTETNERNNK